MPGLPRAFSRRERVFAMRGRSHDGDDAGGFGLAHAAGRAAGPGRGRVCAHSRTRVARPANLLDAGGEKPRNAGRVAERVARIVGRHWAFLALCLTLLPSLPAQPASGPTAGDNQTLKAVKTEPLQNPSSFRFLEELSDRIGPRLTGSPQDARAGQWALETMRAIGLQHVHAEPWQLERGWRRH